MNKNRTFKVETVTTPATSKQISTIISLNTQYIFHDVKYPESKFFSKAHAIMIIEELNQLVPTAEKRPFDKDMYYRLYERFSAKYPENHMEVPVRDYAVDTEHIPEDNTPPKHNGLPTPEEIHRRVANNAFTRKVVQDFLKTY